jgi:hypothetical protein
MIDASTGASAQLLSLLGTFLLFIATLEDSHHNPLVIVYLLKNVAAFGFNIYVLVKFYSTNVNDVRNILGLNSTVFLAFCFDIIFPVIFALVGYLFYIEGDTKEELEENENEGGEEEVEEEEEEELPKRGGRGRSRR